MTTEQGASIHSLPPSALFGIAILLLGEEERSVGAEGDEHHHSERAAACL